MGAGEGIFAIDNARGNADLQRAKQQGRRKRLNMQQTEQTGKVLNKLTGHKRGKGSNRVSTLRQAASPNVPHGFTTVINISLRIRVLFIMEFYYMGPSACVRKRS